MKSVKGNLWNSKDDYIFVTTNSFIKKDGSLVMGRGAAKELYNIRKDLPSLFGSAIRNICGHLGKYGIVWELGNSRPYYGIFQVKYAWYDNADLELIKFSTNELIRHVTGILQGYKISMNFPGIGNGHLEYNDVYEIVKELPDNITLYTKD